MAERGKPESRNEMQKAEMVVISDACNVPETKVRFAPEINVNGTCSRGEEKTRYRKERCRQNELILKDLFLPLPSPLPPQQC